MLVVGPKGIAVANVEASPLWLSNSEKIFRVGALRTPNLRVAIRNKMMFLAARRVLKNLG